MCSRSVGVSLGFFGCTRGFDFSRIRFAGVHSPGFSSSSLAVSDWSVSLMSFATGLPVLSPILSLVCELWNWTRVAECLVVFRCLYHAFGLWEGPGLPLLLSVQTCNTVFLAFWACACRTSCGLAHLIPEISENSCVGVPTGHWSVPFFWHPRLCLDDLSPRCPRCAFHTLDKTSVGDFLIVLPGMNRESNLLRSVSSSRT